MVGMGDILAKVAGMVCLGGWCARMGGMGGMGGLIV